MRQAAVRAQFGAVAEPSRFRAATAARVSWASGAPSASAFEQFLGPRSAHRLECLDDPDRSQRLARRYLLLTDRGENALRNRF